jgi:hypothetical protein
MYKYSCLVKVAVLPLQPLVQGILWCPVIHGVVDAATVAIQIL